MIRKSATGLAAALVLAASGSAYAQLGLNAGANACGNTATVDINTATAAQLRQLGFATAAANNIVAWIQTNGPIMTAAQLDAINGVNATLVNTLTTQHRLVVDTAGTLLSTAQGAAGGVVGGVTNTVGGATNTVGGLVGGLTNTANNTAAGARAALNVNTANVQQLAALGFTALGAQNVVAFIQAHGPVTNLTQLNGVAGVSASLLNTLSANGTLVVQ